MGTEESACKLFFPQRRHILTYVSLQVKKNGESALWQMLDLVLTQFDGLVAGYQARHAYDSNALPSLSRRDLIFLNGNGEKLYWLVQLRWIVCKAYNSDVYSQPMFKSSCWT